MADLIVTFGRSLGGKLEYGPDARTELVTIAVDHAETTLETNGAEDVITVYAQADCWVSIGKIPNAEEADVGANRRFIKEGKERQFASNGAGIKVSVKAA